jgi:hypothetical protein
MTLKYFLLFLIFLLPISIAHLEAGEDKVVGDYIIDFGYQPKDLTAEEAVVLAFTLQDKDTNEIVVPKNVWIRIAEGEKVIFTGILQPDQDQVLITYTFPRAAEYEITARFSEPGVEARFNVAVNDVNLMSYVILLFFVIILAIILIQRKSKSKQ